MDRKPKISLSILLLLLFVLSCSKNDVPPGQGIVGNWRLYETGYSPGAGYIVEKVPKKPLQGLTFTSDGRVSRLGKNIMGVYDAPYYRLDSTQYGIQIIFLKNKKDSTGFMAHLTIEGDDMRIAPPCIEGCHSAYVRIR